MSVWYHTVWCHFDDNCSFIHPSIHSFFFLWNSTYILQCPCEYIVVQFNWKQFMHRWMYRCNASIHPCDCRSITRRSHQAPRLKNLESWPRQQSTSQSNHEHDGSDTFTFATFSCWDATMLYKTLSRTVVDSSCCIGLFGFVLVCFFFWGAFNRVLVGFIYPSKLFVMASVIVSIYLVWDGRMNKGRDLRHDLPNNLRAV